MKIRPNKTFAISSVDILDVNNKESRQMYELKNRIKDVLDSHKSDSKKKKYISDDDLQLMRAILSVFTKGYADTQTSAFDDALKELNAPTEEKKEDEDNETLIKGGPGGYNTETPIVDGNALS